MKLGLHTYSLNLHGIGQAWAGFTCPWGRQLSTFQLFDLLVNLDLEGVHLDDGVLERLDSGYLQEVAAAARDAGLYLEYNFSMDRGGFGIGIQHDLNAAIQTARHLGADIVKVGMDLRRPRPVAASRFHPRVIEQMEKVAGLHVTEDPMAAIERLAPRAFTNHFRDDRIEFQRWGFKLVGAAVGEGDIDMRRAYELFRDRSSMDRINIETELETPLDDMQTALDMEIDAIRRSVRYCREVLGIRAS